MGQLRGRRALVTGSTSGIGLGIARALAAEGAAVMLNGFGDEAEIERMRADLAAATGTEIAYSGADLSDGAAAEGLVREAERALGGVDILVNNAGIQHVANVEDFPPDRWDAIIAINLTAAFRTIRAAVPGMRARGWGRIVNVASAHGLTASAGKSAYVAAKHGIVGLTKTVALETAETAITCNAVCPGWVRTPLVEKQIAARAAAKGMSVEAATLELVGEKHPSKRFVEVDQVAGLIAFLCSETAGGITGTPLSIDGGWTAQ
ncbi:MAG: 3-hydroxybutyrate dehydrogenase [Alphaproteobacteria bacterium]